MNIKKNTEENKICVTNESPSWGSLVLFVVFFIMIPAVGADVSSISIPNVVMLNNGTITLSVNISNVTNISGISFNLTFDPNVAIVTNVTVNNTFFTGSTFFNDMNNVSTNSNTLNFSNISNSTGILRVVVINADGFNTTSSQPVIDITFNVTGNLGSSTPLNFQKAELGDISTNFNVTNVGLVVNGSISVGLLTLPKTGNIDGKGLVTLDDAIYLAKHVIGKAGYETIYADGNVDGKDLVTLADAIYLAKHVIGKAGYEKLYNRV